MKRKISATVNVTTRIFIEHLFSSRRMAMLLILVTAALSSGCVSYHVTPSTGAPDKAIAVVDSYMKRNYGHWTELAAGADSSTFSYVEEGGSTRTEGWNGRYTIRTSYWKRKLKYSDISDVKVIASPIGNWYGLLLTDPTAYSGLKISYTGGGSSTLRGIDGIYDGDSWWDCAPFYLFKSQWQHAHQTAKALLQLRDLQRASDDSCVKSAYTQPTP